MIFKSFINLKTNTTRFSDRAEDYKKYRPGYPEQLIQLLHDKMGLDKNSIVADIGSGTGISSALFLKNENTLYAVEPNAEMRAAAEWDLSGNKNFHSINGTSEKTGLPDQSVDFIFSAQAFHWFDQPKTKIEFKRILKPGGHIVLVWNVRDEKFPFQKAYEEILKANIPEFTIVNYTNVSEKNIEEFFSPKSVHLESMMHFQEFDLDGLKGRLRSSSYCPKEGVVYDKLMKEMEVLFYRFSENGRIKFHYETMIYWC